MSKDEVICSICLKPIEKMESYYLVQSYKLGTFLGRKHYHWNCFTRMFFRPINESININLANKPIPPTNNNGLAN